MQCETRGCGSEATLLYSMRCAHSGTTTRVVGGMVNFESRTTSPASSALTVDTMGSLQLCPLHPGTDHTRAHTRLKTDKFRSPARARRLLLLLLFNERHAALGVGRRPRVREAGGGEMDR